MSDPILPGIRLIALLVIPALLLFPLVVVLFTPLRVQSEAERTSARLKVGLLGLATVCAFALWGGLLLAGLRLPNGPLPMMSQFAWILFFPLWFLFAMPAIRAKNPVWSGAIDGTTATNVPLRTASLGNRARENPITRTLWVVAIVLSVALLAATAARGLQPFDDTAYAGHADVLRQRWLIDACVQAFLVIVTFALTPVSLSRMHHEPEPMDAQGSPELAELYRCQRMRRARGLFWLMAIVVPCFLGAMLCASAWLPEGHSSTLGLVGALGGTIIGVAGAIFGTMTTLARVRISEARERLGASRPVG